MVWCSWKFNTKTWWYWSGVYRRINHTLGEVFLHKNRVTEKAMKRLARCVYLLFTETEAHRVGTICINVTLTTFLDDENCFPPIHTPPWYSMVGKIDLHNSWFDWILQFCTLVWFCTSRVCICFYIEWLQLKIPYRFYGIKMAIILICVCVCFYMQQRDNGDANVDGHC